MLKNLTKILPRKKGKFFFYFLGLLLLSANYVTAQVVINEISEDGRIELKNLGSSAVDVSTYILCNFPAYDEIQDLNTECGNFTIAAGDFLTVTNFSAVNGVEGEMGLYTNNNYTNPASLLDYVEWGTSGHQRATIAEAAGIWQVGTFADAIQSGGSLQYDGTGDTSSDWASTADNTICADNSNLPSCTAIGGDLTGGPFTFNEIGDGQADNLMAGDITLTGNSGENSQWIVTDDEGYILGLPPMPSAVNFDGAGAGTCFVWHLSFDGTVEGLAAGNNATEISGDCFSLSNSVEIIRENASGCQANAGELFGGPFTFNEIGDGVADMLAPGSITLANQQGNSQWIVTDDEGYILGLPPMPGVVNFDVAGAGTCFVWHLSYEGEVSGLVAGNNAADISGDCFALSNSVEIIRENASGCQANAGELFGGPFTFESVGDGVADMIPAGSITLANQQGESQWIVTDDEGYILGLPPMPGVVNFDPPGAGTCLIWHLSYEGAISELAPGINAADITGDCFSLSNSIEVIRLNADGCQANGGELFGGPFTFESVGDGEPDMIPAGSITLANQQGNNTQWIVTDASGYILGLPPMPGVVNFDPPGAGTCLIWHLSYDGEISELAPGVNAADISGDCFSLSNSIEVIRLNADGCQANGGELFGGPFDIYTIGDGVADNLAPGSIALANQQGESQWIVTDEDGMILGLPPMPSAVDFDGAGVGTCFIFNLSYTEEVSGVEVGMNFANISGDCFSLSNSVVVNRFECSAEGGQITGGPFTFSEIGDGEADMIPEGSISLDGNSGDSQWVVTDASGYILGLPPMPSAVNFDGAGAGVCFIWHMSTMGDVQGLAPGMLATEVEGCFSLSNSIMVTRENAGDCQANGGELFGGPFTFDSVGDGEADMIPAGSITLANQQGESQWIVTDDEGYILGLPPMPGVVNFDPPGPGTCLIWHLSYDGEVSGLAPGLNAADIAGDCFSLSNSIEVIRLSADGCQANAGELFGGPFGFYTIGDDEPDMLAPGAITLANQQGESQWIVTDDQGNILGLPPMPSVVDFDGAGEGTCFVYHLSYIGEVSGVEAGANIDNISGDCFGISNAVTVNRFECDAEAATLTGGPFSFTEIGDGVADMIPEGSITVDGGVGETQWIVTDDEGYILGLPPMPSVVNFDGAGAGTCFIWHASIFGDVVGLAPGMLATQVEGCFALSNSIMVTRENADGCQANAGELFGGPFTFTEIGDGEADMIPGGAITIANEQGENAQWVITDSNGNILGLPPSPFIVNFDVAGAGTCFVYNVSWDGEITGLNVSQNISNLEGCFGISNSVTVYRENASGCNANGGELFGGPFTFDSVGDGVADMIPAGSITLANQSGEGFQWIVTDDEGYILGLPPMPSAVNFDGAGPGTCFIWYLAYEGEISGLEVGMSANEIEGCHSLSNSITIIREAEGDCQVNGGELFGGPFTFNEVGDGTPDMIPEGSITVANQQGDNTQWIVTDDEGYILGLPPMPSVVDFDTPGAGTCLIWLLTYEGQISDLAPGVNASDITGDCFALSNSISVIRENADGCNANGGELFGGPFTFTEVGDGTPDMIPAGSITLANEQGENRQWVVTDDEGYILGLPPMPSVVDFDTPGAGTCLIWNLSYVGEISGLEVGMSALEIEGCFSLSNSIEVIRENADGCQANAGELFGGPFTFTEVGDGTPDMIPAGAITLANQQGDSQWIVTDDEGYILGLPPMPSVVDFDTPGAGTCLIWHLSSIGEVSGVEVGLSAFDISGDCFGLSNSIAVIRENADGCQVNGGELFGGPFTFNEVGDGTPDMIPAGSITVANQQGDNTQWM